MTAPYLPHEGIKVTPHSRALALVHCVSTVTALKYAACITRYRFSFRNACCAERTYNLALGYVTQQ